MFSSMSNDWSVPHVGADGLGVGVTLEVEVDVGTVDDCDGTVEVVGAVEAVEIHVEVLGTAASE